MLPILISVPHGGTKTPPEIADRVCLSREDLFDDSDACTREICDFTEKVARVESADIARAFVDLNRSPTDRPPDDPDGVVKTVTCYRWPIYSQGQELTDELAELLLERYYYPYHSRLREAAANSFVRLGLDCHSMAAIPPPLALDRGHERPLFCLSNDDGQTCPTDTIERLADALAEAFECGRADVWLNRPFKGGYITRSHGRGGLPWIQVDMNRSFYLTEPWFDRSNLTVEPRRLSDLRERLLAALSQLDL